MDNDFADLIISVPYYNIYPPEYYPKTPPNSPSDDMLNFLNRNKATEKTTLLNKEEPKEPYVEMDKRNEPNTKNEKRCLCFKC
jgi:hypothetical protein